MRDDDPDSADEQPHQM
jgi:hypothetical protein